MRVWVIVERPPSREPGYWTGRGLAYTHDVKEALWFVRERDARNMLADHFTLPGTAGAVEVEEGPK
jgi:hypothetical protein